VIIVEACPFLLLLVSKIPYECPNMLGMAILGHACLDNPYLGYLLRLGLTVLHHIIASLTRQQQLTKLPAVETGNDVRPSLNKVFYFI
jgi:hypothetical protein